METTSQRIVRNSLHDTLVAYLREMVLNGELRPGDKVPEQALCERFDVSRTPLREALKVLAAEGVLRLQMNRGAVVAETTREEIEEIFPIMAALEGVAGTMACVRATDAQVAELRRLHEEMRRHYEAGSEKQYLLLNRRIHEDLVAMSGNATLIGMYKQMLTRIRCIRFVANKAPEQWQAAMAEHETMITALERRDAPRLAQLLQEHVNGTASRIAHAFASGFVRQTEVEAS
ncbi:DNA-binding transcriptional regulator, GntR family [Noviherbaspirillum humi]|uniref:DNA-binding transcriptional regulator, GntR family n=1 Tax=Noviherbaspirillum humi TaxID=1688639 RepID=A0A239M0W7_9BURK|nr:GntR family transcriptional regulator [Noviherbaspirillum humi]SNT36190.1 DNA-binding transcriptional regulator, GntR family [Noviherbaspirillum humi]